MYKSFFAYPTESTTTVKVASDRFEFWWFVPEPQRSRDLMHALDKTYKAMCGYLMSPEHDLAVSLDFRGGHARLMMTVATFAIESLVFISESRVRIPVMVAVVDLLHQIYNAVAGRMGWTFSVIRPPAIGDPSMVVLSCCLARAIPMIRESICPDIIGRRDPIRVEREDGHRCTRLGGDYPVFDMFPMDES